MDDKDDKGIWQSMNRHPIFAGCAIMLLLMLCLGGACMMGIVSSPFGK
jgi:protein-S-isoprenylcysteine O-methyltransferase Ste14